MSNKKQIIVILKKIGLVLAVILGVVLLLLGYLTIVEYRPDKIEEVEFHGGEKTLSKGDSLSVLTFNIGYGAYDQDEDFFMDGGNKVRPDSAEAVTANLSGISETISRINADVVCIQEIDLDSHRSYNINEKKYLDATIGKQSTFAYNFKAVYVPFPMPPIGKVESGVATYTDFNVAQANRESLPVPFKWPVRTANLKRCMLEERIPIEDSENELVILNFHLEAYDSGEGKIAQTKQLLDKIASEYENGNYVIAAGDFNQTFDTLSPAVNKFDKDWAPGVFYESDLPDGLKLVVNEDYPTCRSLARSFINYEESQWWIIDGFIVSDNLRVDAVNVLDEQFMYSDHNPVLMKVTLK